mmetsp:Transcript_9700/g.32054  ORF Transcript_9700/g.32054 Transcript_9700/m.32054 type:complete len:240 (+) Transcript_9700:492-1211(+)
MASAGIPCFRSFRVVSSTVSFEAQNATTREVFLFFSISRSSKILTSRSYLWSFDSKTVNECDTPRAIRAVSPGITSTPVMSPEVEVLFRIFFKDATCKVAASGASFAAATCTASGHVAVTKTVCRSGRIWFDTRAIWGRKPRSSIRSASSTTRKVHREARLVIFAASRSLRRPGVATTISGRVSFFKDFACSSRSAPPYTQTDLTRELAPNWVHWSLICMASSLVGANIVTIGPSPFAK